EVGDLGSMRRSRVGTTRPQTPWPPADCTYWSMGRGIRLQPCRKRPLSGLEHDPEKACPGLDPGWTPVFGKDHAPRISWSGMTIRRKSSRPNGANTSTSTWIEGNFFICPHR